VGKRWRSRRDVTAPQIEREPPLRVRGNVEGVGVGKGSERYESLDPGSTAARGFAIPRSARSSSTNRSRWCREARRRETRPRRSGPIDCAGGQYASFICVRYRHMCQIPSVRQGSKGKKFLKLGALRRSHRAQAAPHPRPCFAFQKQSKLLRFLRLRLPPRGATESRTDPEIRSDIIKATYLTTFSCRIKHSLQMTYCATGLSMVFRM
jgi:hypothetical protein